MYIEMCANVVTANKLHEERDIEVPKETRSMKELHLVLQDASLLSPVRIGVASLMKSCEVLQQIICQRWQIRGCVAQMILKEISSRVPCLKRMVRMV